MVKIIDLLSVLDLDFPLCKNDCNKWKTAAQTESININNNIKTSYKYMYIDTYLSEVHFFCDYFFKDVNICFFLQVFRQKVTHQQLNEIFDLVQQLIFSPNIKVKSDSI